MSRKYGLFQRFGVELEYMIVDAETLAIRPEADELIRGVAGTADADVSRGRIDWSNELALHLIELKTSRPATALGSLAEAFFGEVRFINEELRKRGALLLPGAMHPWMNPRRESRLWPHGCQEIYRAFDRIFNCRGHGWTNLQSTHLNLPFRDDDEFARLHAAVRVLLPLLPAIAASSPFIDGKPGAHLDMRLEVYRGNCRRLPSLTGRVIPEPVQTAAEYQKRILDRIYRDLAPHDPEGILQHEWANARGAIARFERNTIEIRVLDIQECPAADLAILRFAVAILRQLTEGKWSDFTSQNLISTAALEKLFLRSVRLGRRALIRHAGYLELFGVRNRGSMTIGELCAQLLEQTAPPKAKWKGPVEQILREGSLAERLLAASGPKPNRERLREIYYRLAGCLAENRLFTV